MKQWIENTFSTLWVLLSIIFRSLSTLPTLLTDIAFSKYRTAACEDITPSSPTLWHQRCSSYYQGKVNLKEKRALLPPPWFSTGHGDVQKPRNVSAKQSGCTRWWRGWVAQMFSSVTEHSEISMWADDSNEVCFNYSSCLSISLF